MQTEEDSEFVDPWLAHSDVQEVKELILAQLPHIFFLRLRWNHLPRYFASALRVPAALIDFFHAYTGNADFFYACAGFFYA